jgi:hypothetical protein
MSRSSEWLLTFWLHNQNIVCRTVLVLEVSDSGSVVIMREFSLNEVPYLGKNILIVSATGSSPRFHLKPVSYSINFLFYVCRGLFWLVSRPLLKKAVLQDSYD